jgi:malonyl-CoA/methylmalonyl-CoA synthetase
LAVRQTIALIDRAAGHGDRLALDSAEGRASYADLLRDSERLAFALLSGRHDLEEERIALLLPAAIHYAAVQWGIWRAGGIAVPLNPEASLPEIEHVLSTAGVSRLIAPADAGHALHALCGSRGIELFALESITPAAAGTLPVVASDRRAMILFTSGTTARPKGVVSTHANIQAQIGALIDAWGWQPSDSIPLFLPLHHIHGIVNVLGCALWSGARVEAFPSFDVERVLARVAADAYSVFMAVPTIYVKMIERLERLEAAGRDACCRGFARMRLMVSGSAALPVSIHRRWQALTGQVLLERYGMTEIGMALSNPLDGERRPGAVGRPLPGVMVRLVSESGAVIDEEEVPGEIQVRGPAVFREYWNDATATREAFSDGWFRTGDMAVVERGYYRILGRRSVDIIKSGGYKLSALEIESVLLDHPDIRECAVVGLDEETWGEVVAAAVVVREGADLNLDALREWGMERLSRYKLPKRLKVVSSLPRNAMGKVTKPAVKRLFERSEKPA